MTLNQAIPAAEETSLLPEADAPAPDDEAVRAFGEGDDPAATVAVEYEGRTYDVPAPLKGALMRHGDYTRKTQELAQQRKSVEAAQEDAVHGDRLRHLALARIHALDLQIAPLSGLNWDELKAQDPERTEQLASHFAQLKEARTQTAQALQQHHQAQALNLKRARATQVEEGRARLRQDIEDWSPQTAQKILQAGKAHGFSEGEVHSVTDPRMILVLNKARLFDEHQQRQAEAKRLTAAHAAQPAAEVGADAPATSDPSRMSTAEWMRWRANNLRKRN